MNEVASEGFGDEPVVPALTPQACAEELLGKVIFDPDPTTGTGSFLDEMRAAVTTLCVTAGIETADTTVWDLIKRTSELQNQDIPEDVQALEETLSLPLQGDVIDVMQQAGLGADRPLTQYVQALQATMTAEQDTVDLREDL